MQRRVRQRIGGGGVPASRPRVAVIGGARPAAAAIAAPTQRRRGGVVAGRQILSTIDARNWLAGPEGVRQSGAPLAPPSANLAWPAEINQAFAISIRPLRFQGLQARLGPWAPKVQLWNGTNGMGIDRAGWQRMGKVAPGSVLRAGEIGCYDSHVRIWETIVQRQLPVTLILEDDANLRYIPEHANRLRQVFDELKRMKTPWDILYVGGKSAKSRNLAPAVAVPRGCNGLFAYCLTLQGAKLLLSRCRPYRIPVDVLVAQLEDSNYLKAVAMDPALFYVVPVHSDTVHIR